MKNNRRNFLCNITLAIASSLLPKILQPCVPEVVEEEKIIKFDPYRGSLSEKEWRELLGLEYVLTWRYSDNEVEDEKRYMELSRT